MSVERAPQRDLGALLKRVENAPPAEAVDVVAAELAAMVGAAEVSFLLATFSGRALVRFVHVEDPATAGPRQQGVAGDDWVRLSGTVYGRVLRAQEIDVERHGGGARLIAPVSDRGDALGLLELVLPRYPDETTVAEVATAAHALALVVIASRRYTDVFERGQRSTPLSLAAEIQRGLLPDSFTCEAGQLTVAGWQEPSYGLGGDTFDYALDHRTLHLSITDAVGHSVESATLATILVGSLRNSRRRDTALAKQARDANEELSAHTSAGRFVTGQLLRIDLDSHTATIVNAGHPLPLRVRNGRVEEIGLAVDLPFGIRPGREFQLQQLPLQPGDRIVFVTDGMLEGNAAHLDVAAALTASADLHPRDVVHALGAAVVSATRGKLRDDATVLCVDWYGSVAPTVERATGIEPA